MFHNWYHDGPADIDGYIPQCYFSPSPAPPTTLLLPRLDIEKAISYVATEDEMSPTSSLESVSLTDDSIDSDTPDTPMTEPSHDDDLLTIPSLGIESLDGSDSKRKRYSTSLLVEDGEQLKEILGNDKSCTKLLENCCGGGCCAITKVDNLGLAWNEYPVSQPDNEAFRSLNLNLTNLSLDTELTSLTPLPPTIASFSPLTSSETTTESISDNPLPPTFVQPHPPYHLHTAPIYNARELTQPGAEKKTYHFDIDVTDYPEECGVDFKVGGAIGVCPPNDDSMVDDVLDRLGVLKHIREKQVTLRTTGGRWPTIWGDDMARELTTSRRELLTWCSDISTTPPTKQLLRVLAEYASHPCEAKILNYLCSAEGQGAFCDLRTGPYITLSQLLHAFPSTQPPLEVLFSVLKQLMPRFYSLSNDPSISSARDGIAGRRVIEVAVSVRDTPDWKNGSRTGLGSGYMERVAKQFISQSQNNNSSTNGTAVPAAAPRMYLPMFRGLMANPLSREFTSDGPMLLIGAGVGVAPFRGFILKRLKNANCVNKVWLLQGVRDSSLDELYRGEFGDHEQDVKRVVQSRKIDRQAGEARYVQEEVINQADIVWNVANAVDGRVFVCGSKGMGVGVWDALVRAVMVKGGMNREEAETYWKSKEESGQYICVSFLPPFLLLWHDADFID
jgi:sulfite reductase alpha subunit-like flavoprotein